MKKLFKSIISAVVIILALILVDFMGDNPNKWIRLFLFVFMGILIVGVQLKFGKRES